MDADVIVIGAGVAGLAAAQELGRLGWRVSLLEARDRMGGRVLTTAKGDWPHPVELGAEFIHGGSRPLRALLKRARLRTQPVDAEMWWHEQNQWRPLPDFWDRIRAVTAAIPWRNHGWSLHRYLRTQRHRIPPGDLRLAEIYAASFNAGPASRLSVRALRDNHAGADDEDFKIRGRYDGLVRALRAGCPRRQVKIHLRAIVTGVSWRAGEAIVHFRSGRRHLRQAAPAVIVTLPLGVLQAGQVKFSPPLREKQRLIDRLGWGQVARILFRFRPGFWSAPFLPADLARNSGRGFGFVNAPAKSVPVWWALTPPAPVLTGWAGGEAARRLAGRSPAGIRDEGLRSLAHLFRITPAELRRWLVDWHMHDWGRDPFARGAYSFVVAGLEDGPARLAEPVEETIFFAGEATAREIGTVHGALASGRQAAAAAHKILQTRLSPAIEILPLSMNS